jgi:apolipoprotein N-acyltransferase
VSGTTFYPRHGNWFVWVCAIISLIALVVSVGLKRERLSDLVIE